MSDAGSSTEVGVLVDLEPALVDSPAAAALLGIGRTMFLALVEQDSLPRPIELGRRRLWSVARLRRWAEEEADRADRFRSRTKRSSG